MNVAHLTPILNVSDMAASFAWLEALGWKKLWDWGTPPTFGAVGSVPAGNGIVDLGLCQEALRLGNLGDGGKARLRPGAGAALCVTRCL